MFDRSRIEIKTRDQIELMRAPGLVVGQTLAMLADTVAPGLTTGDLDRLAEEFIRDSGATPSFLGYGDPPFPATLCVSVNDEIVHGIPSGRELVEGDLVSIDCGAIIDGWHGDAALTVGAGEVSAPASELVRVTWGSLWAGVAEMRVGGRVGDIGRAVEHYVLSQGDYGIVEDYTGHGIGTSMHQPPNVHNHSRAGRGARLRPGLVVAIEPMIVAGDQENVLLADEWTVVTADGSLAAHVEHTVAILEDGLWVLTALDGGKAELEAAGVRFAGR